MRPPLGVRHGGPFVLWEGVVEQKPKQKIHLNRVCCDACDRPIDYRAQGGASLYLKCYCGEVIEVHAANLGKEVLWKEKAEYEAEQLKKKENKV